MFLSLWSCTLCHCTVFREFPVCFCVWSASHLPAAVWTNCLKLFHRLHSVYKRRHFLICTVNSHSCRLFLWRKRRVGRFTRLPWKKHKIMRLVVYERLYELVKRCLWHFLHYLDLLFNLANIINKDISLFVLKNAVSVCSSVEKWDLITGRHWTLSMC